MQETAAAKDVQSSAGQAILPYLACTSVMGLEWAEDGAGMWFLSNLSGNWEAYRTRVDPAMPEPAWPMRITYFGDRVGLVRRIPGRPAHALVFADRGGDENWRLLLVGPGTVIDVDPGEGILRTGAAVSRDGRFVAFGSNRRNRAMVDLYLADLSKLGEEAPHRVWETTGLMQPVAFAPDGSSVLWLEREPNKNERLWRLPLDAAGRAAGEPHVFLAGPAGEETHFTSPVFAPDGRTLFVASDMGREFAALLAVDVATARERVVAQPEADVEALDVHPDGRRLAWVENHRGTSVVRVGDVAGNAAETWLFGDGVVGEVAWAPGKEASLGVLWDRPQRGVDIYVLDGPHGLPRAVTRAWLGGLDPTSFVAPEEVAIPTRDGLTIRAWLFRPREALPPYAAVWLVHGGPESMARANFDPITQFLVAQGFAVIKPNVRGSSGYGRRFEHLDDKRRRLDAVDDLADAVHALVAQGTCDGARQAVMGGSYGGYMTLATLTRHPDLWRAGVDIVGIANLVTFLERTSAYRRAVREAEYGSLAEDREFLVEASPMTHLDRLRAPLMVIHGARDPRVPVHEADQIVEALRARGMRVEYLRYEDEGHGLTKLRNRQEAYARIAEFLTAELAPV